MFDKRDYHECRLEKVQLSCIYSKIKILGTLLCVIGAFTMSVMHSASSDTAGKDSVPRQSPLSEHMFDEQKILGCAYLFSAIIILSSVVVLQVCRWLLYINNTLVCEECLKFVIQYFKNQACRSCF